MQQASGALLQSARDDTGPERGALVKGASQGVDEGPVRREPAAERAILPSRAERNQ